MEECVVGFSVSESGSFICCGKYCRGLSTFGTDADNTCVVVFDDLISSNVCETLPLINFQVPTVGVSLPASAAIKLGPELVGLTLSMLPDLNAQANML